MAPGGRITKGVGVALAVVLVAVWFVVGRPDGGLEEARRRLLELPARPPGKAVMIGWHEQFNDIDGLKTHEKALGTRFAVVRHYNEWTTAPSRRLEQLLAEGRLVISSHKPPDPEKGGWGAVASGREDRTIAVLADRYRSYRSQIIVVFHHEPHDDAADLKGGRYGTSPEFVAAFRRIHRIFTERGAHISRGGNVLMGYIAVVPFPLQAAPGGPPGSGDPLYPGDDVVDVLAHDAYNWATCRRERWKSFRTIWRPLVELAAAHRKPLFAGEFGSAPGDRNEWFLEAARFMKEDPLARQWLMGFAYFHAHMDGCHWDFMNQGKDGRDGWRAAFLGDSSFTGTPYRIVPE